MSRNKIIKIYYTYNEKVDNCYSNILILYILFQYHLSDTKYKFMEYINVY